MAGSATIPDAAALVRFHTRHKLLLMAHSPAALNRLGRLVANAGDGPVELLTGDYMTAFKNALEQPATRGGHVNALQHMVGYLRRVLTEEERRSVSDAIEQFAAGHASLAVPLSLIRRHAVTHRIQYLLDQVYLNVSRPVEVEA